MSEKLKILVVDDELAALELVAAALELLGAKPKCVQSSRTAAGLVSQQKFDLVFLDWKMPEMDGLEVARHIRQSKPNRTVPIVMLTARTEADAMPLAFQAGVNFFLTKPVTATKVKRLLDATRGMVLAERRRYRRVAVSLDVLCAWDGERVRGTTANLSPGGILLCVEKTPPPGVDITLALDLPGAERRLELVGKVARVVKGVGAGVQFTQYRSGDRRRLADFVARMAEAMKPETVF